jgi:type II secretory pathway pseudopilin PulG
MYFDFEERRFDTPTIESAMSWRERGLLSLFVHLLAVVLVLAVPRLPFVQEAAERRAERLAQMVEEQQLAQLQEQQRAPEFIFVQPLVDTPAPQPPLQADLSDIDRVAQSPLQAETPVNDLPNADGNTLEFVEAEDPTDGLDSVAEESAALDGSEVAEVEPVDGVDDGTVDADAPDPDSLDATPGDGGALTNPFLADRGITSPEAPPAERPGTLLDQAIEGVGGVARRDTFRNLRGRTDQYGPDIQFDSKGVDFGWWIRRFRAQIYRNWTVPQAAMVLSGHVVLTFNIHRDGSFTELTVAQPSLVDAFTNSAYNALLGSNPTVPLPEEYPEDEVFFTVIFYFNERPPAR